MVERNAGLITAARTVDELEVVFDFEVREHGVGGDADAAVPRIGRELELHGFEVHEQRVRQDVVGPIGLAVEGAGLRLVDREMAVVEHEIALNVAEPRAAQRAQELPDLLDDEIRIAVALDREVAVELLAIEVAEEVDLRGPRVSRPEVLEGAPRRHDLHDRRRAARHLRQVAQDGLGLVDGLHDDADVFGRNAVARKH